MNKRSVFKTLLAVAAVTAAGPTFSDSLDLNFSSDAARLTYARLIADGKLEFDAGWLHNKDSGDVVSISLGRFGEAGGGQQSVTAALGGRLFAIDGSFDNGPAMVGLPPPPDADPNGFALGIGGLFRMKLAGYDRIGFSGHGYYAPNVISFGDSEGVIEVAARVTYSILREADVYLGVRYLNVDFKDRDATMDNGVHIGIRLEF